MAKRQTIWLSTMMVLSLMLIGFYTVNNNVQEVSTDPAKVATNNEANGEVPSTTVMESSDYFVSYHLQAGEDFSKKVEELNKKIAAGKSADEVEKAKKELETMNNNAEKIDNLIELITAEGYQDAIVEMKDGKVNIVVQEKQLDKKKVVKIMNLAAKELQVSSSKITVAAHE
jgi:stage III sporulation protein AH